MTHPTFLTLYRVSTHPPTHIQSKPWWLGLFLSDRKCSVCNFLSSLQKQWENHFLWSICFTASMYLHSSFTRLHLFPPDIGHCRQTDLYRVDFMQLQYRFLLYRCILNYYLQCLLNVLQIHLNISKFYPFFLYFPFPSPLIYFAPVSPLYKSHVSPSALFHLQLTYSTFLHFNYGNQLVS